MRLLPSVETDKSTQGIWQAKANALHSPIAMTKLARMKSLTFDMIRGLMEEHDWNSLHDACYCALYDDSGEDAPILSRDLLEQIARRLPSHLLGLAAQWGCSDTGFRDSVYEFIQEKVKELGSLDAFLLPELKAR